MAKNIVLKNIDGESIIYENVGTINLKDDTGSIVEYIEKPFASTSVSGNDSCICTLIDYDGTIIKKEIRFAGEVFTLPSPEELPTHERLVFQEYSSPIEIINNSITVDGNDVFIGVVYTTVSGKNEMDITITPNTGITVSSPMSGYEIDWGDGTIDSSSTHTYSEYGNYTITFGAESPSSLSFVHKGYCTDARICIPATYSYSSIFNGCAGLRTIIISKDVHFSGTSLFGGCYSLQCIIYPLTTKEINASLSTCNSLKYAVIPYGITSLPSYLFSECRSLTTVYIPDSVVKIGMRFCTDASGLKKVRMPKKVDSFSGDRAFYGCTSLSHINLPEGMTSMSETFCRAFGLTKIIIPSTINQLSSQSFYYCKGLHLYDFTNCASIPTLSTTNVFQENTYIYKIYVPDDLYDSWKTATNWSTYVNYIYKASEMPV